MYKRLILICILAIGCISVETAAAQTATEDTRSAAKEVIGVMQIDAQLKAIMPAITEALKPALTQGRPPEFARDYDVIAPSIVEGLAPHMHELVDDVTELYARHFTADELREIADFYRRPTGQKALAKMPMLTQESMLMGQRFAERYFGDVRDKVIEKLRQRGHEF